MMQNGYGGHFFPPGWASSTPKESDNLFMFSKINFLKLFARIIKNQVFGPLGCVHHDWNTKKAKKLNEISSNCIEIPFVSQKNTSQCSISTPRRSFLDLIKDFYKILTSGIRCWRPQGLKTCFLIIFAPKTYFLDLGWVLRRGTWT